MVLYYFKSKEHLFLVTMRWALEQTEARVRRRIAGGGRPRRGAGRPGRRRVLGPEEDREFYLLYLDLIEHAARVPSFGRLSGMAHEIINGLSEEVIRDGVAHGGLRVEDPVAAAAAMRALIEGTFLSLLQRDDWRASHAGCKALCHQNLRTLLGARRPAHTPGHTPAADPDAGSSCPRPPGRRCATPAATSPWPSPAPASGRP